MKAKFGDEGGHHLLREWGRQLRARENPVDAWPSVGPSGQITEDRNAAGSHGTLVGKHKFWEGFTGEALEVHRWLLLSRDGAGQPEIVRLVLRLWYAERNGETAGEVAEAAGIARHDLYPILAGARCAVAAWVEVMTRLRKSA